MQRIIINIARIAIAVEKKLYRYSYLFTEENVKFIIEDLSTLIEVLKLLSLGK